MTATRKKPASERRRPSWDEYFLKLALDVAERSTCMRRHVGAVLVRDKRMLATGYNGAPRGVRHCLETGCLREKLGIPSGQRHELCRGVHAEMNTFLQAALHGVAVEGASLYCTSTPCSLCAKMLINAGVKRVVYLGEYPDEFARNLLEEAKVELVQGHISAS
ncbi:MAG TPA: cytidine/deoxycytidylate deaminase family protein [Planctomycetota bacterium]|nr:cytidine/deoxycytidylate deaminase family protein [Planctomycetota bacterium]